VIGQRGTRHRWTQWGRGQQSHRRKQSGPGQTITGRQMTQGLQNKTQNKTETTDHDIYVVTEKREHLFYEVQTISIKWNLILSSSSIHSSFTSRQSGFLMVPRVYTSQRNAAGAYQLVLLIWLTLRLYVEEILFRAVRQICLMWLIASSNEMIIMMIDHNSLRCLFYRVHSQSNNSIRSSTPTRGDMCLQPRLKHTRRLTE